MAKREVKFESQDRRIAQINKVLNSYGIASIEEAEAICDAKGIDPYLECEQTQNICFENAKWAYVVGAAIAMKKHSASLSWQATNPSQLLKVLSKSLKWPTKYGKIHCG